MAVDYINYHNQSDFLYNIRSSNQNFQYYPTGITGYEQYYLDLEGFWRQLYNPFYENSSRETQNNKEYDIKDYFQPEENENLKYWNKNIIYNPENLNFWFDFFDTEISQVIGKYGVKNIGNRPKISNDNTITSIYYRQTPDLILTTNDVQPGEENITSGWIYMQISQEFRDKYLSISGQGKSAVVAIGEYLTQYTNAAETINISSVPIYFLQPNTKIWINDLENNIKGEYIISTLSFPLSYNGNMSITAKKVIQTVN